MFGGLPRAGIDLEKGEEEEGENHWLQGFLSTVWHR